MKRVKATINGRAFAEFLCKFPVSMGLITLLSPHLTLVEISRALEKKARRGDKLAEDRLERVRDITGALAPTILNATLEVVPALREVFAELANDKDFPVDIDEDILDALNALADEMQRRGAVEDDEPSAQNWGMN